jgi:cellulose synthase/poly-beta-1,6-N-acetylglucosamine synthase-like glycosyltransferase
VIRQFIGAVALLLIAVGIAYFALTMGLGWGLASRQGASTPPRPRRRYHLYVLIPCLNESLVIGATVRSILEQTDGRVVVIDDGSDDDTGKRARAGGRGRVMLVRRNLPDARLGKGAALNAGYHRVVEHAARHGFDSDSVLICVMDADGRLSHGGVRQVMPLFDDPAVGGVQIPVRIRNRHRLITVLQDLEFWTLSAVSQLGRMRTQTVSLGGNGQFTRLSALVALGRDPWSHSLTEDLDLALSLLAAGWNLTSTPHAYVDQQGVTSWRRLVRQRIRWYQGTITCSARLGELWRTPRLSNPAVLEVTLYLLVPTLLVLPWSVVFHLVLFDMVAHLRYPPPFTLFGSPMAGRITLLVVWYLVSFAPNIVTGFMYARRDRELGLGRSLLFSHLLIPYNYVAYLATWVALGRILTGRRGWSKTERIAEPVERLAA